MRRKKHGDAGGPLATESLANIGHLVTRHLGDPLWRVTGGAQLVPGSSVAPAKSHPPPPGGYQGAVPARPSLTPPAARPRADRPAGAAIAPAPPALTGGRGWPRHFTPLPLKYLFYRRRIRGIIQGSCSRGCPA